MVFFQFFHHEYNYKSYTGIFYILFFGLLIPFADLKIFQVASSRIRAQRRYEENLKKGIHTPLSVLEEEIKQRDYLDENKPFGALKKAKDAIEIDTSNMSIEEVVETIIKLAKDLIK